MSEAFSLRFNEDLRSRIANNVVEFQDDRRSAVTLRAAAVAIVVVEHDGEGAVIVTRRTPRLKDHGGQWALPGGRVDAGETTVNAALRELSEEVGLELTPDAVLGTLDDYVTRSGFVISPVVMWSEASIEQLRPAPDEVASIHPFPFSELARTDSPNLERIPESDRQVLSMNLFDSWIYAPTAAMLYQFREVAFYNNHTRVSQYDGPVFTWQ